MMDYGTMPKQSIMCIDMKSFYASCSAVMLGLDPLDCYLAVVGDLKRTGSIVLAASPKMKKEFGIKTGS
ncbi:UV damage repair protein UvrX, partial [Peribacillus frigoritolerans]|nr:UV damage repair protein UvrX [Peribacillus frigoritolerans]